MEGSDKMESEKDFKRIIVPVDGSDNWHPIEIELVNKSFSQFPRRGKITNSQLMGCPGTKTFCIQSCICLLDGCT